MKPEIKIIFKNGKRTIKVNGTVIDKFELLAIANDSDNEKDAWETMNIVSIIFHPDNDPTFNSLYGAVAMSIVNRFKRNEFYYQELFKKHYPKIFNGKIIKRNNDGKNIPDVWVKENGKEIPVEVKLCKFDKKALMQLQRYMEAYKCDKGYAVARELSVDLPSNIRFLPFEILEILENTDKQ